MFENLINTKECVIRGQKFTFSEIGSDVYIKEIISDDTTEKLTGQALAQHSTRFAGKVVSLSLAPNSEKSSEDIFKEFLTIPRTLQDELYDIAAELNGLVLVQQATGGKVSQEEGLPEN